MSKWLCSLLAPSNAAALVQAAVACLALIISTLAIVLPAFREQKLRAETAQRAAENARMAAVVIFPSLMELEVAVERAEEARVALARETGQFEHSAQAVDRTSISVPTMFDLQLNRFTALPIDAATTCLQIAAVLEQFNRIVRKAREQCARGEQRPLVIAEHLKGHLAVLRKLIKDALEAMKPLHD